MPATKDKCVVIPLDKKEVLKTVHNLPRLPSETGIIDVQWKRQIGQKNHHLQAKVDPVKLFNAIQFLQKSGNKHYIHVQTAKEFESRCLNEDPLGYSLIFGTKADIDNFGHISQHNFKESSSRHIAKPKLTFYPDGFAEPIFELKTYLELKEEDQLENQYKRSDLIRKYQLDYDENICMVET